MWCLQLHLQQRPPTPLPQLSVPRFWKRLTQPRMEHVAQPQPIRASSPPPSTPGHSDWFRNGRKIRDVTILECQGLCPAPWKNLSLSLSWNSGGCEAEAAASANYSEPEQRTSKPRGSGELCASFLLFEPWVRLHLKPILNSTGQ